MRTAMSLHTVAMLQSYAALPVSAAAAAPSGVVGGVGALRPAGGTAPGQAQSPFAVGGSKAEVAPGAPGGTQPGGERFSSLLQCTLAEMIREQSGMR